MVMISHPATELVKLQGNMTYCPKENEMETLLKILRMQGSKINLSQEGAHGKELWSFDHEANCFVKSLNLLEGKNTSLSPLQHVAKLLGECETWQASNQCLRNSCYLIGFLTGYCYLFQNLRLDIETCLPPDARMELLLHNLSPFQEKTP